MPHSRGSLGRLPLQVKHNKLADSGSKDALTSVDAESAEPACPVWSMRASPPLCLGLLQSHVVREAWSRYLLALFLRWSLPCRAFPGRYHRRSNAVRFNSSPR